MSLSYEVQGEGALRERGGTEEWKTLYHLYKHLDGVILRSCASICMNHLGQDDFLPHCPRRVGRKDLMPDSLCSTIISCPGSLLVCFLVVGSVEMLTMFELKEQGWYLDDQQST